MHARTRRARARTRTRARRETEKRTHHQDGRRMMCAGGQERTVEETACQGGTVVRGVSRSERE
eukprot:24925-Pleurochrysis_carterae.AAC.1